MCNLSPDTRIYVTDGESQVYGYNVDRKTFWSNAVFAAKVFVQVQMPARVQRTQNSFAIAAIAHLDYGKAGGESSEKSAQSAPAECCGLVQFCRADTPVPNPSPEQKLLESASLGVAHIAYKKGAGWYICSAGLVADKKASKTPFLLTAHHCLSTQTSASTLEAYFQFRATCGQAPPPLSSLPKTLESTLLATSEASDFTLVQLSQRPPQNSYYFSWSTESLTGIPTSTYRIHHPHGYSQHLQLAITRPTGGCSDHPLGPFTYVNPVKGGTAPGSSGSQIGRLLLLRLFVIDGRSHEIPRVNGGQNDLLHCRRVVELADAFFGEHPS
jgi:lysyl endopeptidase